MGHTASELSLYLLIACLLCPLLILTLCAWKPTSLTAVVTSINYSVCPSNARVGVDSMSVHSPRPTVVHYTLQALSIAKLSIAPFTTLSWISTCEGALGRGMAREGANETEACSLISFLIHFATSIKFYWYLFMDPKEKLRFINSVREYRGSSYLSTRATTDSVSRTKRVVGPSSSKKHKIACCSHQPAPFLSTSIVHSEMSFDSLYCHLLDPWWRNCYSI